MPKQRLTFAAVGIGVLAVAVAMLVAQVAAQAGTTASSTCDSSAGKCLGVTVSPQSPAAGASVSFSFTITNDAVAQQLGSARITAPSGFVLTNAPGAASFTSTSALFLNLNLAPSAQTTLTVNATVPCSASSSSYQWGLVAKQSNDFNGPPGNGFQIGPTSAGNLAGTVTGSCSLAFTSDGEPTGTVAGQVITSSFNSSGGPVKVEVLDGSGQPATTSTAAVVVAIGSNPGSGRLSGTTTVDASGGIASFPNLSIDKPGIGYTLTATSPGIISATSPAFTIWGSLTRCSASSCSASASSKNAFETVTTSSATSGQVLGIGLGGVSFSCGSTYQETSDPVSFDLFDSSGVVQSDAQFSVTLEILKNAVQSSGHSGASSWQICYASTTPFTAQPGTSGTVVLGGVTYHTGLLPDCSSSQPAPCVQARNKDNGGDVVITFLATGDPIHWA
jgi:hypothetical protein